MRSYHHLTRSHRYQISRMLSRKKSIASIAKTIGVHRSTIYREIKRNSCKLPFEGIQYDPWIAENYALEQRTQRRVKFRKITGKVQVAIESLIRYGWSPQQIAGRISFETEMSISHETIYRHIVEDAYRCGDLWKYLPSRRINRKRLPTRRTKWVEERRFISQRPKAAEQRSQLGHWERDLIVGKNRASFLLTLVDRKSRYTKVRRMKSRKAAEALRATKLALKGQLVRTITSDNGVEFMQPSRSEKALKAKMYYTNPYASWEKGSNENTNGVIRRFLPKGTDFNEINKRDIQEIEYYLNYRPMKVLGYKTPHEVHNKVDKNFFEGMLQ